MERLIKLMWAEKFQLPPNDERLLSLTLREAAEQVFGMQALERITAERSKVRDPDDPEFIDRNDDEARLIADTPHLTGDPEWDALELAETDPLRPTLAERR
jgi:hypothetical protein